MAVALRRQVALLQAQQAALVVQVCLLEHLGHLQLELASMVIMLVAVADRHMFQEVAEQLFLVALAVLVAAEQVELGQKLQIVMAKAPMVFFLLVAVVAVAFTA